MCIPFAQKLKTLELTPEESSSRLICSDSTENRLTLVDIHCVIGEIDRRMRRNTDSVLKVQMGIPDVSSIDDFTTKYSYQINGYNINFIQRVTNENVESVLVEYKGQTIDLETVLNASTSLQGVNSERNYLAIDISKIIDSVVLVDKDNTLCLALSTRPRDCNGSGCNYNPWFFFLITERQIERAFCYTHRHLGEFRLFNFELSSCIGDYDNNGYIEIVLPYEIMSGGVGKININLQNFQTAPFRYSVHGYPQSYLGKEIVLLYDLNDFNTLPETHPGFLEATVVFTNWPDSLVENCRLDR